MTDIEMIDVILSDLYNNSNSLGTLVISHILRPKEIQYEKAQLIRVLTLLMHDLAKKRSTTYINDTCLEISERGIQIIANYNSYSAYLESITNEKLDTDEISALTIENLRLKNKQLKWYIIYSIIAFISGAILSNIKIIWAFFI